MKRCKSLLIVLAMLIALFSNVLSYAGSREVIPVGRQYIDDETVGRAVVTKDVNFNEKKEIVLGEEVNISEIPMPFATSGSNVTITPRAETIWYGFWSTCRFVAATDNGSYTGYCAQPQMPTPSGVYQVTKLDSSTEFGKKIKLALMYGEDGPWYSESVALFDDCVWSTCTWDTVPAFLHALIGFTYSGHTNGLTDLQMRELNSVMDEIYNSRGDLPIVNDYTAYVAYNDNQDIVWLEHVSEVMEGSLMLKKSSSNPTITNKNSCYDLSGAVYGVYKDKACTIKAATLTTTSNGTSNTVELKEGNYYVKEITAPKGYILDSTVYPVSITAGNTAVVNTKDEPKGNSVDILLKKVDAQTNENKAQGSATLENAEFTVKYYDVQTENNLALNGYTPVRTWVVKTDEDGYCRLNDEYKVSGDEWYMLNGSPILPLGTITIQETKASEGYLINDEIFICQIKTEKSSEGMEVYIPPIIPEKSLNLKIIKTLKDTEKVIPGVIFMHTLPDGTTEEVTTDSNGRATLKGLTYGIHTVEEKVVPEGYVKNSGKIIFEVAVDNTVTLKSNTSEESHGEMIFSVQTDGASLLEVENILQPYSLRICKVNETGKCLEGAEFTLYSDENCTKKIETGRTSKNGILTFSNLAVGQSYYLKETKAPPGYRIPVLQNGGANVYVIQTQSNPETSVFEYYLNGKKYTEETGDYAIEGTKNERIVNLKIINQSTIEMPETGTHVRAGIFAGGVGSMAFILFYYIKQRKDKTNDEKKC